MPELTKPIPPETHDDFLWDGHRWIHKPHGSICDWTFTPDVTERFSTAVLLVNLHAEVCDAR